MADKSKKINQKLKDKEKKDESYKDDQDAPYNEDAMINESDWFNNNPIPKIEEAVKKLMELKNIKKKSD